MPDMAQGTSIKPRKKLQRIGALALAGVLAGGLLASGTPLTDFTPAGKPSSAEAFASEGAGLHIGTMFFGNFIHSDGSRVYCADMALPPTVGTPAGSYVDSSTIPGFNFPGAWVEDQHFGDVTTTSLSGENVAKMNYILTKYGDTADPNQAAAVAFAVWKLREPGSSDGYKRMYNFYVNRSPETKAAGAKALAFISEATTAVNEAKSSAGNGGDLVITPDNKNAYKGTVTIPKGATDVTIKNGVFDSNGKNTITFPEGSGAPEAQKVAWSGIPPHDPDGWGRYYRVEFSGHYAVKVVPATVALGIRTNGIQNGVQKPKNAPPKFEKKEFKGVWVDPDTIWSPVLSTETPSKYVPRGEAFSDTVTFDVKEGSNPWRWGQRTDGTKEFAPITAKGTLYGPFLQDPADNPQPTPPKNAPIAATAEVTTDVKRGPGKYEVNRVGKSEEAGYYTWVWNIDFKDQKPEVNKPKGKLEPSLPEKYHFSDGFGRATEGQTTPTELEWRTDISKKQVALLEEFTDDVVVKLHHGGWLQTAGERTPFVLEGTLYETDGKPAQQPEPSPDAKPIGSTKLTVNKEGTFTSEPLRVPLTAKGTHVTMQWCIRDQNQPETSRGKVKEECDEFGVPSETAEILYPEVKTTAVKKADLYDGIYDTAEVSGTLPKTDNRVSFELFKKALPGEPKYDENWNPIVDENGNPVLWTEADLADLKEQQCEIQPVATVKPVPVEKVGKLESEKIEAKSYGTMYWVETLESRDPDSGKWVKLHRGKCGIPNETTEVEPPKVKTEATESAVAGEEIFDTAIVSGKISDSPKISYEVTFEAFHVKDPKTQQQQWCTASNKVWETTKPAKVTKPGHYKSEGFKTTTDHIGKIYWVESLWQIEDGKDRTKIHEGECGAEKEITKVEAPKASKAALAMTGTSQVWTVLTIVTGVLLILAAAAMVWIALRNRARNTDGVGDSSDQIE